MTEHIFRVNKPCTVRVTFAKNSSAHTWLVSHSNGKAYHLRDFEKPPTTEKISFPKEGLYYSNIAFENAEALPLEAFNIKDTLPEPERNYNPEQIIIKEVENIGATPARTLAKQGIIEKGNTMQAYPSQVTFFILLHELGHQKYKTEWKTDRFALYYFLLLGYNPSQAFYALSRILKRSPEAIDRILKMYKILINY